jgi:hypothetical protein
MQVKELDSAGFPKTEDPSDATRQKRFWQLLQVNAAATRLLNRRVW